METILQNKKFIKASIVLVVLLALLTLAKFINEVKSSDYVGRSGQQPATITVSGTADVMAVSDIATISVNLTKDASTSKEAQRLLNESLTKVVEYLKTEKIEDKDIKSEYGGVSPKYSYETVMCITYPCPQKDPKITGYTATQSISVKVRDVDNANTVRTGLTSLGVVNVTGPTFSIDNEEGFKDQAREAAIADAREEAEILAKQLHVRLGKIITFSEGGNSAYPMMYKSEAMMAGAMDMTAPAPTLPKGENKITSNVTITYEIR